MFSRCWRIKSVEQQYYVDKYLIISMINKLKNDINFNTFISNVTLPSNLISLDIDELHKLIGKMYINITQNKAYRIVLEDL